MLTGGVVIIVGRDGNPITLKLNELTYEKINRIKGLGPQLIDMCTQHVGTIWTTTFGQTKYCMQALRAHGERSNLTDVVKVGMEEILQSLSRLHTWYVEYFTSASYDYTIPDIERIQPSEIVKRYKNGLSDLMLGTLLELGSQSFMNRITLLGASYRALSDMLCQFGRGNYESGQGTHADANIFRDTCIQACHATWNDLETQVKQWLVEPVDEILMHRAKKEHIVFHHLIGEGLSPFDAVEQAIGSTQKRKVDPNKKLPDLPDLDKLFGGSEQSGLSPTT